jgi:hypothetical protein
VDGEATVVWYVRGLERGYDPTAYPLGAGPPRVVWAVVDDLTGGVVARGTEAAGPPDASQGSTE